MNKDQELEIHALLDRLHAPSHHKQEGRWVELSIVERLQMRVEAEVDPMWVHD